MKTKSTLAWLTKVEEIQQIEQMDLESILVEMTRYGRPRIHRLTGEGNRWWVICDMHVSSQGVSFEVKSDGVEGRAPTQEARECLQRIIQTLNQYKE